MKTPKPEPTNLVQLPVRGRPRKRQTLEERAVPAREAIFAAAAKVVGERGYADASIARITEVAGIAQGTFYLYFQSRQSLFDEMLPHVGEAMVDGIRERTRGANDVFDLEERGFRAFFEFMSNNPGFVRVLSEAEVMAPVAWRKHFDRVNKLYVNALYRGIKGSEIRDFKVGELETVVNMLMGARHYLYQHYLKDSAPGDTLPEHVVQTYMKMVRGGLR